MKLKGLDLHYNKNVAFYQKLLLSRCAILLIVCNERENTQRKSWYDKKRAKLRRT